MEEDEDFKVLLEEKAAFLELEKIAREPCPLLKFDLGLVELEPAQFWIASLRKKNAPMCLGERWLWKTIRVEPPNAETVSLAVWLSKFVLRRFYVTDGAPLPNRHGGMMGHNLIDAATWLLGREGFLMVSNPEEKQACKEHLRRLADVIQLPVKHPHVAMRHNRYAEVIRLCAQRALRRDMTTAINKDGSTADVYYWLKRTVPAISCPTEKWDEDKLGTMTAYVTAVESEIRGIRDGKMTKLINFKECKSIMEKPATVERRRLRLRAATAIPQDRVPVEITLAAGSPQQRTTSSRKRTDRTAVPTARARKRKVDRTIVPTSRGRDRPRTLPERDTRKRAKRTNTLGDAWLHKDMVLECRKINLDKVAIRQEMEERGIRAVVMRKFLNEDRCRELTKEVKENIEWQDWSSRGGYANGKRVALVSEYEMKYGYGKNKVPAQTNKLLAKWGNALDQLVRPAKGRIQMNGWSLTEYVGEDTKLPKHSDQSQHYEDEPLILSLSVGADAVFAIWLGGRKYLIILREGDMLAFRGSDSHAIESIRGWRVNLTLRAFRMPRVWAWRDANWDVYNKVSSVFGEGRRRKRKTRWVPVEPAENIPEENQKRPVEAMPTAVSEDSHAEELPSRSEEPVPAMPEAGEDDRKHEHVGDYSTKPTAPASEGDSRMDVDDKEELTPIPEEPVSVMLEAGEGGETHTHVDDQEGDQERSVEAMPTADSEGSHTEDFPEFDEVITCRMSKEIIQEYWAKVDARIETLPCIEDLLPNIPMMDDCIREGIRKGIIPELTRYEDFRAFVVFRNRDWCVGDNIADKLQQWTVKLKSEWREARDYLCKIYALSTEDLEDLEIAWVTEAKADAVNGTFEGALECQNLTEEDMANGIFHTHTSGKAMTSDFLAKYLECAVPGVSYDEGRWWNFVEDRLADFAMDHVEEPTHIPGAVEISRWSLDTSLPARWAAVFYRRDGQLKDRAKHAWPFLREARKLFDGKDIKRKNVQDDSDQEDKDDDPVHGGGRPTERQYRGDRKPTPKDRDRERGRQQRNRKPVPSDRRPKHDSRKERRSRDEMRRPVPSDRRPKLERRYERRSQGEVRKLVQSDKQPMSRPVQRDTRYDGGERRRDDRGTPPREKRRRRRSEPRAEPRRRHPSAAMKPYDRSAHKEIATQVSSSPLVKSVEDSWEDWDAGELAKPRVRPPEWRPPIRHGPIPTEQVRRFQVDRKRLEEFYSVAPRDAWHRYHDQKPVPSEFWEYLESVEGVEWVTSYEDFKDVLLRKRPSWYRDRESQENITSGYWIQKFTEDMQNAEEAPPPLLLQHLSVLLGDDVAGIAAALHCPADEFLEFQREHKQLKDVNPVAYTNVNSQRIDRWSRDREFYEEKFCNLLMPGEKYVTWKHKKLLKEINTIHDGAIVPAPRYTMDELVKWLYGDTRGVPRWAYWFYDRNGNLRTDQTINGNAPYQWISRVHSALKRMSKSDFRAKGLDIPQGHDGGL